MSVLLRGFLFALVALSVSLLHNIEFSQQTATFKRIANGEQVSEINIRFNTADALMAQDDVFYLQDGFFEENQENFEENYGMESQNENFEENYGMESQNERFEENFGFEERFED